MLTMDNLIQVDDTHREYIIIIIVWNCLIIIILNLYLLLFAHLQYMNSSSVIEILKTRHTSKIAS